MLSDEIAVEVVRLGLVREWSTARALRRLTELSARAVPGCAGATCSRWSLDGHLDTEQRAASHPELAELIDVQLDHAEGPLLDAVRTRRTVRSEDTLTETRWPRYCAAMLRRGVRSFHTTVYERDDTIITLTLYAVQPGVLDPAETSMGALLAAIGGTAIANTEHYGGVQRTVVQLQNAVESRAIVDQAKGILMNRFGYDADRAFQELRRISQTRHVKLTVLARRIVAGQTPASD
ncbi:GAF and ANTAR domain-containing protein [Actinocorallia longicatena]|uniref:GAF and ANTAR domain-containing protein n=1 Tax=Actinocorallia longicatena TaxID=111803 RepID=UPI0031DA0517